MRTYSKLYMDGAWVVPSGTERLEAAIRPTACDRSFPAGDAGRRQSCEGRPEQLQGLVHAPAAERGQVPRPIKDRLKSAHRVGRDVRPRGFRTPLPLADAVQVGFGVAGFATASKVIADYPSERNRTAR